MESHYQIEIKSYDILMVDGKCQTIDNWLPMATRYMTRDGAFVAARKLREAKDGACRIVKVTRTVVPEGKKAKG